MRTPRRPIWVAACLIALICLVLSLEQLAGPLRVARAQQAEIQVQQAGCQEWVTNGDFSADQGWVAGADPILPQYVTSQYHSPPRSMLLGIQPGYPGQAGNSSIRQQYPVTIPNNAGRATLTFWYLAVMPTTPSTDYIELNLLGPDGRPLLTPAWRSFSPNQGGWTQAIFDLSGWRGLTIQLYFNVYNDGGPTAALYLDDVSLVTCTGGTVVPTPYYLPSPTQSFVPTVTPIYYPTPTPPGPTAVFTPGTTLPPPPSPVAPPAANCTDLVQNGNFAQGFTGWNVPNNRIQPQMIYVPGGAYAQLGSWQTNLDSYSSIHQPISIPAGPNQVWLDFSTWTWSPSPPGNDRQEADFLAPNEQVLQKFWRVQSNDRQWVRQPLIPVTAYAGQNVLLYFNVYNDGASGVAGMYLGEVHIWVCGPGAISAGAAPPSPEPMQAAPQAEGTTIPTPGGAAVPTMTAAGTVSQTVGTVLPPPGGAAFALRQTEAPPTITGQASPSGVPEETEEATESAEAAPLNTVLVARGTPPPPVVATVVGRVATVQPLPAPPNLFTRLAQALRLPQGWPLGLLAIVVLLALFIWALRQR